MANGEEGDRKKEIKFVKWFSESNKGDGVNVGGKGASLAEMYNAKLPVPAGFVVTADAYRYFLEKTGIRDKINSILDKLDINDTEALNNASVEVRKVIENSVFPEELKSAITEAYEVLDIDKKGIGNASQGAMEILRTSHEPPFVAVRSSATAEDLVDASFAGQQDSFLNVKGNQELLRKVRQCFSSLFTARAIYYREKKGFEHDKVALAVVVQKMIDSEKSGVMFTRNPIKKDDSILVEAVWGLGEGIVSGRVSPDNYVVSRDVENLNILDYKIAEKKSAVVRDSGGDTRIVKLTEERAKQRVLNNYEIKRLAQYGVQLEEHYGLPQDVEFAISNEQIFIVQSRPITTKVSDKNDEEIDGVALLSGLGASPGIGSGVVRIVKSLEDLNKVKNGDVLVTEMTNPDMVVSMQKASAIITDEGGLTSHASIVSREMGIPAVVGTGDATGKLEDGMVVTVDGNVGKVYEGRSESRKAEIEPITEQTKTKIKVIVDLPDYAERAAKSESKSVGLVRLEGIIAASGKHPLKFVKDGKVGDYISLLTTGLKEIVKHFEEVWIRSSDIRTDEYRNLIGASKEVEGNPMLGDHGIRFSLRHPEIVKAEFQAIKEIADEFPEKKIGLMAPQIISVSELQEMKRIAKSEVFVPKNVKIGIMVETPAAVQLINKFCEEGIDFVSFGTNDLTQYTLAIDRNNSDVQYLYDELHPAVLHSIAYVIRRCQKYGVETSICGQAGSKPEMAKFLVKNGIDSITVNADSAAKISKVVADVEKELLGDSEDAESKNESVKEDVDENVPYNGNSESQNKEDEGKEGIENENVHEGMANIAANNFASAMENEDMTDIEERVLRELEDESDLGDRNVGEKNEYSPGYSVNSVDKNDIPSLNDAIPFVSGEFKEEKEEQVIDLSSYDDSGSLGNSENLGGAKENGEGSEDLEDLEDLESQELEEQVFDYMAGENLGEKHSEDLGEEILERASAEEIIGAVEDNADEESVDEQVEKEVKKEDLGKEWTPEKEKKDREEKGNRVLDIF